MNLFELEDDLSFLSFFLRLRPVDEVEDFLDFEGLEGSCEPPPPPLPPASELNLTDLDGPADMLDLSCLYLSNKFVQNQIKIFFLYLLLSRRIYVNLNYFLTLNVYENI